MKTELYNNHLKEVELLPGTDIGIAVTKLYFEFIKNNQPQFICFNGVNIVIF